MNNKVHEIKAVIFDLDGTIVDSEPIYFEADKKVFEKYGINIDANFKKKYIGLATWEMIKEIKSMYNLVETVEELVAQKNAFYLELAKSKTTVFPEMKKFIKLLKENNYPLAVASGSSREVVDAILKITGLQKYFDVVISSSQVKEGKPAPDVFLAAARMLDIAPEKCLVLEDSHYGVEAAKSAGMHCIAMPLLMDGHMHSSFNQADLLFENGIEDFTADKAFGWLINTR